MPKALDPIWKYDDPTDEHNQQKLKCKLCGKEMTQENHQLAYHLAQILTVTPEIIHIAIKSLEYAIKLPSLLALYAYSLYKL